MSNITRPEERLYDEILYPPDLEEAGSAQLMHGPLFVESVTSDSYELREQFVNILLHKPSLTLGKAVQFFEKKCEVGGKYPFSVLYDDFYHSLTLIFFSPQQEPVGEIAFRLFKNISVPSKRIDNYVSRLRMCSSLNESPR